MTDPGGGAPLVHVDADLRLDIDGVRAQVSGSGQRLTVTTRNPLALLWTVLTRRPPNLPGVRDLADVLAEQGLSVTFAGPHGPLTVVGADASASRWGVRGVRPGTVPAATAAIVLVSAAALTVVIRRR